MAAAAEPDCFECICALRRTVYCDSNEYLYITRLLLWHRCVRAPILNWFDHHCVHMVHNRLFVVYLFVLFWFVFHGHDLIINEHSTRWTRVFCECAITLLSFFKYINTIQMRFKTCWWLQHILHLFLFLVDDRSQPGETVNTGSYKKQIIDLNDASLLEIGQHIKSVNTKSLSKKSNTSNPVRVALEALWWTVSSLVAHSPGDGGVPLAEQSFDSQESVWTWLIDLFAL